MSCNPPTGTRKRLNPIDTISEVSRESAQVQMSREGPVGCVFWDVVQNNGKAARARWKKNGVSQSRWYLGIASMDAI
jgi:hypothetical protein